MGAALMAALAEAQAEMRNPGLDSANPHYNSRFASLKAVLDSVRGPLNSRGLFLNQTFEDGCIKTAVWDASGDSATVCSMPVTLPADPQKAGSAVTYARRYSLLAAFGLVGEPDDDGEAASAGGPPQGGPFTARCRSCGRAYAFEGAGQFREFLATDGARCCERPDWKAVP